MDRVLTALNGLKSFAEELKTKRLVSPFVVIQPNVQPVRGCVRNEECGMVLPAMLDPRTKGAQ